VDAPDVDNVGPYHTRAILPSGTTVPNHKETVMTTNYTPNPEAIACRKACVLGQPTFLVGWGGWADLQGSVRAIIMGRLVKLSKDTVESYDSDYYHDAMWLKENIDDAAATAAIVDGFTFYFSFDSCGTYLSTGKEIGWARDNRYICKLTAEGRKGDYAWHLTITEALS
jgi:hypothetical protein